VPRLIEAIRAFFQLAHEQQQAMPSVDLGMRLWDEALTACNPNLD